MINVNMVCLYLTAVLAHTAMNLLNECGFSIHSNWDTLARCMNIPLDTRHKLRGYKG